METQKIKPEKNHRKQNENKPVDNKNKIKKLEDQSRKSSIQIRVPKRNNRENKKKIIK